MYKLQRNYILNPLKIGEKPIKEDLIYLYIELNLNKHEIVEKYITNKSISTIKKYLNYYNIHKPLGAVQQKIKQTNLNKYGVENPFQNKNIKEKIKQTNFKKYGTEYALQSDIVKQKTKQTNLKKYGHEYAIQSDTVKEIVKRTNMKKYGVEYVIQSDIVKEKIKQTNLEKYGVENPFQNECIKEKIKQTNLQKYGKCFAHQRHISQETIKILQSKEKLVQIFEQNNTTSRQIIAYILGVSVSCIDKKIQKYGLSDIYVIDNSTSSYEEDIYRNICNYYNGDIQRNIRVLDGKEIDIFLPDIQLGIEFNGTYWHSERVLSAKHHDGKWYHYEKSKIADILGIKLIHIFEYEYTQKREQYLNYIRDYIEPNTEIDQDDCFVKIIDNNEMLQFMEKYSIDINQYSDIQLGLYYNDDLCEVISIIKQDNIYELVNYGKKYGITINNGLNMLFDYFVDIYKPQVVYGFSKNNKYLYNPFEILNFSSQHISEPECITIDNQNIYDCGKTYWKWISDI